MNWLTGSYYPQVIDKVYQQAYGRNSADYELSFHREHKTDPVRLYNFLISQPERAASLNSLYLRYRGRGIADYELQFLNGGKETYNRVEQWLSSREMDSLDYVIK